jgi:hypothetical protein
MVPTRDRSYEDERAHEVERGRGPPRVAEILADPAFRRQAQAPQSPPRDFFGDPLAGLRASGNLTAALRQEKIQTLFIDTASL